MPRYRIGPVTATRAYDADWYPDGETRGDMVHDDGSWSEDQPTGIFKARGHVASV